MICICIQCASSYILYLVVILYIYIRIIVLYVYTYLYLLCNTFEIRDSFSLKMQRQGIFSAHCKVKTSTILTTGGRRNVNSIQSKREGMSTCTATSENTIQT